MLRDLTSNEQALNHLPIFPIFFAAKKTPSARSKSAQRGVPIVPLCSGLSSPWKKSLPRTKKTSRRRIFLAVGPFLLILRLGLFERNFGKIRCLMEQVGKKTHGNDDGGFKLKLKTYKTTPTFFGKHPQL